MDRASWRRIVRFPVSTPGPGPPARASRLDANARTATLAGVESEPVSASALASASSANSANRIWPSEMAQTSRAMRSHDNRSDMPRGACDVGQVRYQARHAPDHVHPLPLGQAHDVLVGFHVRERQHGDDERVVDGVSPFGDFVVEVQRRQPGLIPTAMSQQPARRFWFSDATRHR